MNAPTLFDVVGSRPAEVTGSTETGHGRGVAAPPTARHSDPQTSHEAAAVVRPGNGALIQAIRDVLQFRDRFRLGPVDAFYIAYCVEARYPNRWARSSILTAVSRAGLRVVDEEGRSPRGQRARRYSL